MMKYIKGIVLVLFLIVISLMSGCTQEGCSSPTGYSVNDGIIRLDREGTIQCELCDERNFASKIIVTDKTLKTK